MHYGEAILNQAFNLLENIDKTYNSYQQGSFFNQINTNAGSFTEVDATTIYLLKELKKVAELTNGVYDITTMPLIKLWRFYKNTTTEIPTKEQIKNTLNSVNYNYIEIEENKVKIANFQEIITGSFIKAYAVDCVIQLLKEHGITDAIINAGGSTIAALTDDTHPNWKINLPHPFDTNKQKATITLSNGCFSLSARNENYININGKKYGHILNAKTGYPSDNLQLGLISENAFIGDVLSTALFSVPPEEFIATAKKLAEHYLFKAYLIDGNEKFHDFNFNNAS
ncbi:hypothetical protein Y10_27960 [Neptunitalea sp. Y10]|uniref:FAD:protein FMN transferase n=2 Tax=Neptunitalea lumnitzerae TaxID=2965509 RepID=A0ABQ5MLY1_9FLAO|nr:hypothetical protein Y10_27960 [Neptunitalea sp. Y10]